MVVEYIEDGKRAIYGGLVFVRDDTTGYYLNSTLSLRLHRAVYEGENGPIPDGFHVHHVDFDKSNNEPENLVALSMEDHLRLHERCITVEQRETRRQNFINNVQHKSREWHGSEDGIEWHRKHYEAMKDALHRAGVFECIYCGKRFEAIDNGAVKFCSNACKSAFRRASGVDNETRVCFCCGGKFNVNKYSETRCCSRRCAAIMRWALRTGEVH